LGVGRGRVLMATVCLLEGSVTAAATAPKHAAYLLIVKRNQPALRQKLTALPWREVPVADTVRDRGHGHVEIRRLQVTTVAGLGFPTPPRRCASPAGPGRLAAADGAP
jgi:hypothetical protein